MDHAVIGLSRRALFAGIGAAAAVSKARAANVTPTLSRGDQSFQIRFDAALLDHDLPQPDQPSNGDEQLYPNRIANFSKGLPHNALGEADPYAYGAMVSALNSGQFSAIDAMSMGSPDPSRQIKMVNPMAGFAFDLEGADSHNLSMPPAPAFASSEAAGEMAELYWQALARDVPFAAYDTNPITVAAAADLNKLSVFRGPKVNGAVTASTLFRGFTPGDLAGPYVSQFLLRAVPYGAQAVDQRILSVAPGLDYATSYDAWMNLQNGLNPGLTDQFDGATRYIRGGRDLARWVHMDVLFQAYINAAYILLMTPDPSNPLTGGGLGAPWNPGNPYNNSRTQTGFGTFGGPHISAIVPEVASRALKAVWYQKWLVHRRLRPEEFGGRVHYNLVRGLPYPIHSDLLNSAALQQTYSKYGTYLLPQAFPEGCPLHPSYGAGHATVAGACVTILKAFFDETHVLPNPVVASADGLSLDP
jgi:hypothetical protein